MSPFVKSQTTLDAVGNTTAAMGKGFAIGSAALTAMALFVSYAQQVEPFSNQHSFLYNNYRSSDRWYAAIPFLSFHNGVCI